VEKPYLIEKYTQNNFLLHMKEIFLLKDVKEKKKIVKKRYLYSVFEITPYIVKLKELLILNIGDLIHITDDIYEELGILIYMYTYGHISPSSPSSSPSSSSSLSDMPDVLEKQIRALIYVVIGLQSKVRLASYLPSLYPFSHALQKASLCFTYVYKK
jgi:hypothetical protein